MNFSAISSEIYDKNVSKDSSDIKKTIVIFYGDGEARLKVERVTPK